MNKQYRQQFILPYFQSHQIKDQALELKIFGCLGLVESQLLLRSLNKFAFQTSKFISPYFFDDQAKKHHQLRGLSKYQITYIEQIRALRDSLITKKKVDLQLSVCLEVLFEDIYSKYMELDTLVQVLNQMAYLHHLVLDAENVESFDTISEGFEELTMNTYHNSLRSLSFANFKFNDQKSSLILSKIIDVQSSLKVIKFEKCQLHCDSIQALINYLGSGYGGGQSLVEIAFIAIDFDWQASDEKKPRNQQQELAIALLKQSTLTSLTIKHTSDMKDFIYEILTRSGIQSEQPKDEPEELEQIYSETELENDELFDNLNSDRKSDQEVEDKSGDAFEANLASRNKSEVTEIQQMELNKTEYKDEQNWAEDSDDQFNFDDAMTRTRGEAFTIRGDKNKPSNIVLTDEQVILVKEEVVKTVVTEEEDDNGFGFNFDSDPIRNRGEAFTIKTVKPLEESVSPLKESQTLPTTEDKQDEETNRASEVKNEIIHQEITSEHNEGFENNQNYDEYQPRSRGQAMTFSKAKNKEELEKIKKAIQEQIEDQNDENEDGFDMFEDRLLGRTRGEAITIKAVKEPIEEKQVIEIKQEIHIHEVKNHIPPIEIKQTEEVKILIQEQEIKVVEEIIVKEAAHINHEEESQFDEEQFQPRARGQAMTISKTKNKEELEVIQKDILEQQKQQNYDSDKEEGFGFNDDAFMTRSRGQAFTIKEVNNSHEDRSQDDSILPQEIKAEVIVVKEIEKIEAIVTIQKEINEEVFIENKLNNEDQRIIQEPRIDEDEVGYNEGAFQPRSRGEAMTISKSKNKEVLEEIQKGIQEQQELINEEDDQFGYFDQQLAGRTRGEAITIKGKEKFEDQTPIVEVQPIIIQPEEKITTLPIVESVTLIKAEDKKEPDVLTSSQNQIADIKQLQATKVIDTKLGGKGLNLAEASVLLSTPIITSTLNAGAKVISPLKTNQSPTKGALPLERSRRTLATVKKPATKVEVEKTILVDDAVRKDNEVLEVQQLNSTKHSTQPKALILDKEQIEDDNDMGFNFDQLARTRAPATTMGKGKKVQFNIETEVKVIPKQSNTIIEIIIEQEELSIQETKASLDSPNKSRGLERSRRTLMAQKKPPTKVQSSVPISNLNPSLTTSQTQEPLQNVQKDKLKIEIADEEEDDQFGFNFDAITRARGEAMTFKGQKKGDAIVELKTNEEGKELAKDIVVENIISTEQASNNDQIDKSPNKTPVVRSRRTITLTKKAETKEEIPITSDINLKETTKVELNIESNPNSNQPTPLLGKTPLSMSKNTLLGDNKKAVAGFDFGELAKPKGETLSFNKPISQFQMKPAMVMDNQTKLLSTEVKVVAGVEKIEEAKQLNDSTSPNKGRLERSRRTIAPIKKPPTKVIQVDNDKVESQSTEQLKERFPHDLKQDDEDGFGFDFDQMTRQRGAVMTISKGSTQAQLIQEQVKQQEMIQAQQEQIEEEAVKIVETTAITKPLGLGIAIDDIKIDNAKQQVTTPSKGRLERSRRTVLPIKKPVTKVNQQNNDQTEATTLKTEIQQIDSIVKDYQEPIQNAASVEEDGLEFDFDQMTRSRGAAMTISKGSNQTYPTQEMFQQEESIITNQEQNKEVIKIVETVTLTKPLALGITIDDIKVDNNTKQQVTTPNKGRLERSRRTVLPIKKPVTKITDQSKNDPQINTPIEDQKLEETIQKDVSLNQAEENEEGFGFDFDQLTRQRGAALTIAKTKVQTEEPPENKIENKVIEKQVIGDLISQSDIQNAKSDVANNQKPRTLERSRRTVLPVKKPVTKVVEEIKIEEKGNDLVIEKEVSVKEVIEVQTVKEQSIVQTEVKLITEQVVLKEELPIIKDSKPSESLNKGRTERSRRTAMTIKKVKTEEEKKQEGKEPEEQKFQTQAQLQVLEDVKIVSEEADEGQFGFNIDQMSRARGEAMSISKPKDKEEALREINEIINSLSVSNEKDINRQNMIAEQDLSKGVEVFNPVSMHGNLQDQDDNNFDDFDSFNAQSSITRSRGEAMSIKKPELKNEVIKEVAASIEEQRVISKKEVSESIVNPSIEIKQESIKKARTTTFKYSWEVDDTDTEQNDELSEHQDEESKVEDQFVPDFDQVTRQRGEAMSISNPKNKAEVLKEINEGIEVVKSYVEEKVVEDKKEETITHVAPVLEESQSVEEQKIEDKGFVMFNPASMYPENDDEEEEEDQFDRLDQFDDEGRLTRSRGEAMTMKRQKAAAAQQPLSTQYANNHSSDEEDEGFGNNFDQQIRTRAEAMSIEGIMRMDTDPEGQYHRDAIKELDDIKVTLDKVAENQKENDSESSQKSLNDDFDSEDDDQFNMFDAVKTEKRMTRARGEAMSIKQKSNQQLPKNIEQAIIQKAIIETEPIQTEIIQESPLKITEQEIAKPDTLTIQSQFENPLHKENPEKKQEVFNPASIYSDNDDEEGEDQFDQFNMDSRMTRSRGEAMTISKAKDKEDVLKEINAGINSIIEKDLKIMPSIQKVVEPIIETKKVEAFNPASMYEDDDEEEDQFAALTDEPMTRSRGEAMTIKRTTINKGESFRPPIDQKEETFKPFGEEEDEDQFDQFAQFNAAPRMTRTRGEAMTIKKSQGPPKQEQAWQDDEEEDQFARLTMDRAKGFQDEDEKDEDMFAEPKQKETMYRSRGGQNLNNKDKVKIINDMLNPTNDKKQELDNKVKVQIINEMLNPSKEPEKLDNSTGTRQRGQAMTMKKKDQQEELRQFHSSIYGQQRSAAMTVARAKVKPTATIKSLQLVELNLEDSDIIHFKEGFNKIQGLESLELYGNSISNEGVQILGEAFKNPNFKSVKYLGLRSNQIDDTGFYQFLCDIAESPYQRLEHLSACTNQIEMEYDCKALVQILKRGYLKKLDLVGCPSIQMEGLLSLDHAFQKSCYPSNEAFNLLFTDEVSLQETQYLAKFMKEDKNLQKIVLYDYFMEEEAAISFFYQIFQNEAITVKLRNLSIFYNALEDADVALLTQKLDSQFPALKILDLRGNSITDSGAILIAEALADSYAKDEKSKWLGLQTLNLNSNPIGYEGLFAIIEALKDNRDGWGIRKLKMSDVDIDSIITFELADYLISNTTLSTLLLGYNGLRSGSGLALEQIISYNTGLHHFDFEFNEFNSDDGKCIINGLKNRTKKNLRKMNIEGNKFGEDQSVIKSLESIRNKEIRIKIKM